MDANGFVIYQGPSMLDGAPIAVIATGFAKGSGNAKTGAGLIQTWIIRTDVDPNTATHTGQDASICGGCPHRGRVENGRNVGRSCYVTVFTAPLSVFRAYHRGVYPVAAPDQLAALFEGRGVRLGSYGDPAAAPSWVWSEAVSHAAYWTGYTHQWRTAPREFALWCMASADSEADRDAARAMGYRTFRVAAPEGFNRDRREILCPASEAAGKRTTCDACRACGGRTAKARVDVMIPAHGSTAKVANARRLLAA